MMTRQVVPGKERAFRNTIRIIASCRFVRGGSFPGKGVSGFSLLELLVSVTLLALVLALIYGAFYQVSNSSISVKATLETRQELRLLMKMVLDDLQAVQYLRHFVDKTEDGRDTGIVAEVIPGPETAEFTEIHFHAAIPSRFYQDVKSVREGMDPGIHEIGYFLELDPATDLWQFKRREDFYIDEKINEDGRVHVLSESVSEFDVDFLLREIEQAAGGAVEEWSDNFDSHEGECYKNKEPPCLPRAIRLKMSLKEESGRTVSDSQVINLCVRPCKPELFE